MPLISFPPTASLRLGVKNKIPRTSVQYPGSMSNKAAKNKPANEANSSDGYKPSLIFFLRDEEIVLKPRIPRSRPHTPVTPETPKRRYLPKYPPK